MLFFINDKRLIMKLTGPYDPCPCGSGKKYKFCCYQKKPASDDFRASSSFGTSYTDDAFSELLAEDENLCMESYRICQQGLLRMRQGALEEAMPYFRQATDVMPLIYTPANNLAVCLMALGRLDEAIKVQEKSLKVSHLPNPFGLANMATFLLISGDEVGCRRHIDKAVNLKLPSGDACVKLCEVLARFRRHQDIIDLIDACAFEDAQGIFFFSGVAAANLGDIERARNDLRRVNHGFYKADMVRRYLQHIKEGTQPHTIRGDWPYLFAYEDWEEEDLED
ncbi:MAG: tetratricopeptide repeat protein [Kiritimatiellae bacterium]|nr:tetratricopeptide repeat protein [Kiritimatiellia bacterium]